MICSDLHVHSLASKRPSEWFLQKVGAKESYTDIDTLYTKAKEQGMTYVTVTDHNTIEGGLDLMARYPEDTFLSVEVTTYFPETKCKIHILVYDITPEQFENIDNIRKNIYSLRSYLFSKNIAHSIAHATYAVNKRLDINTLEKLILMFDVFEGLNGARNSLYNETWHKVLENLTPETIERLKFKHGITPLSLDPWRKGITGGSDDHAGLFIGQTFTSAQCGSGKKEFIRAILDKNTLCSGRCNDYKSFAFSIYKIFCDFSSRKNKHDPSTIRELVSEFLFTGNREHKWKSWITRRKIKQGGTAKDKILLRFFDDVQAWAKNEEMDVEARMDSIYKNMATLLDGYMAMLFQSLIKDFGNGDAARLFKNISSSLPLMFISIPFFSSLKHLFMDRDLIGELKKRYIPGRGDDQKRILWFTDTIDDLNGVAINLRSYMKSFHERNPRIKFAVCVPESHDHILLPNTINLPEVFSHTPEFYDSYTLRIPSILNAVDMIYKCNPEKIIISTPGPVGLIGLLMSRLMGISCSCIYHTDFAFQAQYIFNDETITSLIHRYIRWFYSCADGIRVPTKEYMNILENQGYDREKMKVLKRGFEINPPLFSMEEKEDFLEQKHIPKGFTLMWAGRISKDKRIHFLADIYKKVKDSHPEVNLVICGEGPDIDELKSYLREDTGRKRVFFTGRLPTKDLLEYYACSDLFVFPSTTDTFGMVIVEAQACGLPVLVTDVGGPQEIMQNGETGFIIPWDQMDQWVQRIENFMDLKENTPEVLQAMSQCARQYVQEQFSWDAALEDIVNDTVDDSDLHDDEAHWAPHYMQGIRGYENNEKSHKDLNGNNLFLNDYLANFELPFACNHGNLVFEDGKKQKEVQGYVQPSEICT